MLSPDELSPAELGLPKKFDTWREGQFEAIDAISLSDKRVYLLDAPWGIGKSVIGIGAFQRICLRNRSMAVLDRMTGKEVREQNLRCLFVTRTKQLQQQVVSEFPRAKTIKGRRNFPCLRFPDKFPDITAEDCTHQEKTIIYSEDQQQGCEHHYSCPYLVAKGIAYGAPLAVLNTSYFLAEANGPGLFSGADFVILDEIDSLESELMSHIELRVSESSLKRFKLELPKETGTMSGWLAWAETVGIQDRLKGIENSLEAVAQDDWSDVEIRLHKNCVRLKSFQNKIKSFVREVSDDWVFYEEENAKDRTWVFKPTLVSPYAEKYIWRHSPRFLGMSATILESKVVAGNLGLDALSPRILDREDAMRQAAVDLGYLDPLEPVPSWEYAKLDCPFPKENRPIYFSPVANLTRAKMERELPKLLNEVLDIVMKHPQEKILIHATSYAIRDYLMEPFLQQPFYYEIYQAFKDRVITHTQANRAEMLELFKTSIEPLVMISPSFDRGVDLPDDTCRCIIICKVPYISLGDPQVRKRMELPGGELWYLLRAAQTLMQMTGRGVRHENDFCATYILDKQFRLLLTRVGWLFPGWWKEAIK